ncbi:MAG: S41 family peptidase [Lachnospiraceae bacterium]|nr:S41 family peptidase [Lachnospiraceae bacterium]MBQ9644317.1 S41 family peptidase [Lachnospiraceae bacterium]
MTQKSHKGLYIFIGVLIGALLGALLTIGGYIALSTVLRRPIALPGAKADSAINTESTQKLLDLEQVIDDYYYDTDHVTKQQLEDGMYKGLMNALGDPYSVYYNEEEMSELMDSISGTYYGIGAYLQLDQKTNLPTITGTIPNTPAEAAGLLAGDIIYKVDDEEMYDVDIDLVARRVRGPEGTQVHLTIYREGEKDYLEFDITRAKVDMVMVTSEMKEDGIGYLDISEFTDITTDQFKEELASLQEQGMKAMILDLRGNPGGDVDVVTEIAGYFIPEGLVFYMEDKYGHRTEYKADGRKQLDLPLVVLVDGNSASASEILSGAIKDSGTGTLLGTTTYGKGIVQTILDMDDGTAVKVTVADYYTRNGNYIHKTGIEPDVKVEFDGDAYREDGTDNQLEEALKLIRTMMDE